MEQMEQFETYLSPLSWRYGSIEMRQIWSEINKRKLWRQIWVCLAKAQLTFGLVTPEQLSDLENHVTQIDMKRALEIEAEIHHDLMAELRVFAEQSPLGGNILHLGATSMDIEDNAEALRIRQALTLILQKLKHLLLSFVEKIDQWDETPILAFTHLQPAEPSTLGYRLALYAQDLMQDWDTLASIHSSMKGKGFKGAVGTAASYIELIGADRFDQFEEQLSRLLGLPFFPVSAQIYPRKQEYRVISALAGLGASLYKFAYDIRFIQSPPVGEWSEPFAERQVGSSAMPFKRNPILSERLNSLARLLASMPQVAWQNAAHSMLERTLDDNANRRTLLPEAFILTDELLMLSQKILSGLKINLRAIQKNLELYAPFASTERLLMKLVQASANRQQMHEIIRSHAMKAWQAVQEGNVNPLIASLSQEPAFLEYLTSDEILRTLNIANYTGIASRHARQLAQQIQHSLEQCGECL
jgi:adenylosuccinate lyase